MKEEEQARHILIPLHEKISEKEKKELLERYNVTVRELPKISPNDPALAGMEVKQNDVIKITRNSPTAGKTYFYRGVSSD
ncbi:MAG: DNA-directed RNA polymerase subunit H [Nanoarchaeota archaeon]|nr:DNA-directed RNA polymerase subunit H [Nanoarchaeota archaeon]